MALDDRLIQNVDDLYAYLRGCPTKGVYVDSAIRKDTLTDRHQGKIVIDGRVRQITFQNLSGGVWEASLE